MVTPLIILYPRAPATSQRSRCGLWSLPEKESSSTRQALPGTFSHQLLASK
jgi:hypothetical protein